MNYKESKVILNAINKAKYILLLCHTSPDPDSVVSCLVMERYLVARNKNVDIFSKDQLHEIYKSIDTYNKVAYRSPNNINFDKYDILFTLDGSDLKRYGIEGELPKKLIVVNIDHHNSTAPADLQIKDYERASTSEMIYLLLEDLKYEFTREDLNLILLGIISDSDKFTYNVNPNTFKYVQRLLNQGADYYKALEILYKNNSLDQILFKSNMLKSMKIDKIGNFAYTHMRYEDYSKYNNLLMANREVADNYVRTISGTGFGISMLESEKNNLHLSIRSRTREFSLVPMLEELGGGGYDDGGGAAVKNMPFDDAVRTVIKIARKHAKKFTKKENRNS